MKKLFLAFLGLAFISQPSALDGQPASQANGDHSTMSHSGSASCGTPYDTIPNFAQNPTMVTAMDGPWSAPSTWSLGRLPLAADILLINHQVTYDSTTGIADVIGIDTGASLRFRTDIDTKLQVGVVKVFEGGRLEIGTASAPVVPAVKAELIIRDRPLDLASDPKQFGTGLLSHSGTVTMHGTAKNPSFVRTAVEPTAGNTTLTFEQPVTGWPVGGRRPNRRRRVA